MNDKHLYLRGATFALAVLVAVTVIGLAWAQGGGDTPDCYDLVTGTDTGCSPNHACDNTTGCTSTAFTAGCSGTYLFDVWTTCTGGVSCSGCRACAMVYKDGQQVGGHCFAFHCADNQCYFTCSVNLDAGIEYQLWVCLDACPNYSDCSKCGAACTAHACLRLGQTATCY